MIHLALHPVRVAATVAILLTASLLTACSADDSQPSENDVDILIRRADLSAVKAALEGAGFTYRHSAELDVFLGAWHIFPIRDDRLTPDHRRVQPAGDPQQGRMICRVHGVSG